MFLKSGFLRDRRPIDYRQTLTLEEPASVAAFSRFHFHRVFYAETGETLFQFIQWLRLEKAALLLRSQKQRSITDIAMAVGFSRPCHE